MTEDFRPTTGEGQAPDSSPERSVKKDPLSTREKRLLHAHRRRVRDEAYGREVDTQIEGLPLIDDIAAEILRGQLNLDVVRPAENPYLRGLAMVKGVFRTFDYADSSPLLFNIRSWQTRYHGDNARDARNASAIGMAIVINAFQMQDPDFIEKLKAVPDHFVVQAFEALGDVGEGDILGSIMDGEERIPSYQLNLLDVVGQMARACRYEQIYEGATAMYGVLNNLHRANTLPGKTPRDVV